MKKWIPYIATIAGVILMFLLFIPIAISMIFIYAYAEYINFAEAYDISEGKIK